MKYFKNKAFLILLIIVLSLLVLFIANYIQGYFELGSSIATGKAIAFLVAICLFAIIYIFDKLGKSKRNKIK